ncbi:MAG: methyltransferase domain-containing protein [Bryobacteraceae bacterium]
MTLQEWNERYRTAERAAEDPHAGPTPLLKHWTDQLPPGRALDLACGAGRNGLYLAEKGWTVTAVDGASAAIDQLRQRAAERNLMVETVVADLTSPEFSIEPNSWNLIAVCYYLQRDLFPAILAGVRPGGCAIAVVHISEEGEPPSYKRAERGELRGYFKGWKILHDYEGKSHDPEHRRSVAEIVAEMRDLNVGTQQRERILGYASTSARIQTQGRRMT